MAHVLYYTKVGCLTAAKQIDLLRRSGHEVEVLDLLAHPWTAEELATYLGGLKPEEWFNDKSPRVNSGEVDPAAHDWAAAIGLLLEDHLLIRRPLIESGGVRACGFDPEVLHAWIGLASPDDSVDYQACSLPEGPGKPASCP